jgi:tetratricopeptide (TPR) repeat protein
VPYDEAAAPSADVPESPEYKALIDVALNEYGLQHYEEARILFVRANVLSPNARALRGIGLAQYELRNYAECVVQLRAALSSQVKPLSGPMRAATEEVAGDLQRGHLIARETLPRALPVPRRSSGRQAVQSAVSSGPWS